MTLSRSVRHLLVSAVACCFVLYATPAQAGPYYSRDEPLTAREDGVAQAQGYGNMSVKEHTWLYNSNWRRDPRPGGSGIFHVTDWDVEIHNYAAGWHWRGWANEDKSGLSDSGQWRWQDDYFDYTSYSANRGRVRAKVCESQNNSFDPCSSRPYQTFGL